ncbi:MAG: hypothetical protein ACJAUL_003436 [Paraglaciecola sp.]|jgi:hypothetical protein
MLIANLICVFLQKTLVILAYFKSCYRGCPINPGY